jgi:signal peptidase I
MTPVTPGREEETALLAGTAEEPILIAPHRALGNGKLTVLKPGPPVTRSQRPDYRLRGLDLGADSVVDSPARPPRAKRRSRYRLRRLGVEWAAVVVVVALAAVLLRVDVFLPYSVPSASMAPTFQPGDQILAVNSKLLSGQIRTGDIIVFRPPGRARCGPPGTAADNLVERVIGLPGQTIRSADDRIYINGRALKEPGWYNPRYGQLGTTPIDRTVVAKGHYYVMTDNRIDACDSRSFGPIPRSLIVGRVVALVLRDGHPHVHLF